MKDFENIPMYNHVVASSHDGLKFNNKGPLGMFLEETLTWGPLKKMYESRSPQKNKTQNEYLTRPHNCGRTESPTNNF